jgi:tetratricopeptide (TPR) repeat protein
MRHTLKCLFVMATVALSLALTIPVFAQQTSGTPGTVRSGALMPVDVYTPIAKGYDFVQQGKYEAAQHEFAAATKLDKFNPFALNNMAVLQEREGKLNDALANLKDATLHAAQYHDKAAQTCFAGGGCMAVRPTRQVGTTSTILPILQENIQKLEAKIAVTKTPPPPVSPPPMTPQPKTK